MDCWHGKYEQLWLNPMIRNSWTLWYIGNLKVLIYLVLYYLINMDAKHFWQKILLRILWIFGCCYTLWNYLEVNDVFWMHWTCELLMWLCRCPMMLVITLSWRQEARLETHTLYDMGKSLSVWVKPLPIGQKTTCKRGTMWHIIPCCPWERGGGEVNPLLCGWG